MKRLLVFLCFICKWAASQPPVNNQCVNATTISIPPSGTACVNGTLTGATDDGSYAINCERPNVGEVWFAFVATGSNNQVTVRPIGNPAARNLAVVLRADSCNGPLSTCDSATTANGSVTVSWAYTPGKTVYVSVSSNTNSGGTFEICITSIQQPPVGGKDCSTAELLCTKNSFTTSIAPGSNGFQPPCFSDPLQRPIIYKFTVGVSGLLNWRAVPNCTTNPNTTEFDWAVYNITNGCPGTLVSCNYNFTGNPGFPPLIPPSPPITSPQGMQGGTNANNAGCSANPPNTPAGEICAGVNVIAGNTYVIYIDQYTSSSNCSINFDFNGSTFEMAPFARFTASDTVGCGTLTTTFTNTSVQGTSYLWNFDDGTTSTLANPPAKTFSTPGTYLVSLTATSATGCVSVATKTILVKPQPSVTVNNDTLCSGSGLQATLTATPSIAGGTFSWNPGGQNTSSITVQPANSTNYTVTYNLNGCTSTGVGRVTVVNPNFTVDAQRDTVICGSQSTRLTAVPSVPGNYTYRWSPAFAINDSTSPNPIVSPNITTRYTVTVRNSQGCVATDTVLVGVIGQGPSVKAKATPPIICPGQSTTLSFVLEPRNCGINNSLLGTGSTNVIGDIGTSNSIQSGTPAASPTIYGNFVQSTRNQYLYRANELAAAIGSGGRITAIGFYIGQFNSNATLENFTIRMACTNDSVLNQFINTGLQTVFGPVSYVPLNTPITGLNLHNLTNFFDWDGQSNIIVDVCWSNNTNGNANNKGRVTATSYNSAVYSSGANNQCGASGGTVTVQRPNTRFIKGTQGYDSLSWVPHTGVNAVSNRTALSPTANPVFTQTYTINVYNKGCVGSDIVTVTVDTSLRVNAVNDTTICPGGTAQLNASVTGNLGAVTYSWSPASGLNNPNIANPRATPSTTTSYVVLVTSSGCQSRDTVNVIVNPPVVNVVGTNVSCFNASNGTVTANVTGGTPSYTFSWSNAVGNIPSQSNLPPATYTVTVTDAKGCTATGSYTVSQPPQLTVSQQSVRNVLCNGGNTGFISVTVSGGTPGYNFTWNPPNANNDTIENLSANTYQLTVSDANNCTATRSFTITQPTALTFGNPTTKNIRCRGGNDGSIIVSANGGTGNYNYAWSHNAALNSATAVNLSAGTYTTTVTDQNGCTALQSNTLSQPPTGISFNPFTVNHVTCFGGSDGSVRANPTGGLPPYSFQWNVSGNTNQISGLTAGTYRVTVTDDSLCTAVDSAVVSQALPIAISGSVSGVSCFGGSDGQISVSASPTGVSYTYQWSHGANGANISNLPTNNYTVTATNSAGCTATATFNVSQPGLLVFNSPTIVHVSCFGGNNGSVTANPGGGTPNYTFSWSNDPFNSNAVNANLSAGNYQVTVRDAKGCTATATYNVNEPPQMLFAQPPAIANVLCHGANTGSIAISVSGGTPSYNYSWSNGLPNQSNQQNLSAGPYSVTVSDVNGCSISNDFTILQPPAISLQTQVANHVTCGGGSDGKAWAVAIGGVGNFTYLWSNGSNTDTASNLAANVLYTVTATDGNQCTTTATISVTEPPALSVNPIVSDVRCFLGNDGRIDANPFGGTPPYSFSWSNGNNDQIAQGLSANAYSCTITDRNNCSITFSRIVSQPGLLQALATGISESCVGNSDGKILMSANGGVSPYSFSYTLDGINVIKVSGDTAFNLKPASYSVIVTDGNNCTASTLVNVGSPAVDIYAAYADTTSCYGSEYKDGRIRVSGLTAPNAPYRFQLNDSGAFSTSGIFENLSHGTYKIYAVNNFGCDTTFTIEVPQPLPASVDILPGDTTLLLGESIQLFGYLKPYGEDAITAYSWSPSAGLSCVDCFNPVVQPYRNSNFQLTIFYKNGCFATSSVRIKVLNNEELYVPNVFSPNGDGVNEKFDVFGYGIKDFRMKIFNRWGEKIFESNNQYESWDGTYKGVLQNPDTYIYVLQVIYLDDKELVRKGTITLIR